MTASGEAAPSGAGDPGAAGTGLVDGLNALEREALARLSGAPDDRALEDWRVEVLGRRGALAELLRGLGALSPQERPAAGAAGNRVKGTLEAAFAERQRGLRAQARERELEAERIDVTLPGRGEHRGLLHPITQLRREVEAVFMRLGFTVVEGPEVEYDRYNFTLLNMPEDHPSRDMQDTFYIGNVGERSPNGTPEMLLRTHTSPVQIRTMLTQKPPIRVLVPGRAFRNEATDAAHEAQFSQVEGLCVDEHTTMGDLRGCLTFMVRSLFGEARQVRFRCGYFPFVEPGAEFDMSCHVCDGRGCRTCQGTGWIEIGGCGMVHPIVLENGGLDPARYSGWAFGFGFERMGLVRYGVDDIRLFYGNDLRFLSQFK
jgi:phenylalanyl-tRNA synthetase alpha chain